jgi:hypothetical protein
VEDALRASQWHAYKTRREFRQEMRQRAEVWSGRKSKPIIHQTSKRFIYHLVHAGMCMVEETDDAPDTAETDPGGTS